MGWRCLLSVVLCAGIVHRHISQISLFCWGFFFFFFQTGHSFDDVECLGDGLPLFVFIPTKLGPELYIITFIAAGVCG